MPCSDAPIESSSSFWIFFWVSFSKTLLAQYRLSYYIIFLCSLAANISFQVLTTQIYDRTRTDLTASNRCNVSAGERLLIFSVTEHASKRDRWASKQGYMLFKEIVDTQYEHSVSVKFKPIILITLVIACKIFLTMTTVYLSFLSRLPQFSRWFVVMV